MKKQGRAKGSTEKYFQQLGEKDPLAFSNFDLKNIEQKIRLEVQGTQSGVIVGAN